MYKISTWNIDRPSPKTKKTGLVIEKILEVNSDIIVLTETSSAVDLSSIYPYTISTEPYERTPTEQWVTIWSKWQIIEQLKTVDNKRTVLGVSRKGFVRSIRQLAGTEKEQRKFAFDSRWRFQSGKI